MATIANPYDPNNPNADQNAGGGGTVMPSTGSTGDASSGGGGGGSAPSASYSPPNVSQYLAANQGAGQQLSSAIQGNVQNQANQVGQSVSNTQNQLNTQYQPLDQNLHQGQQVAKSAFQDPSQLLADYNAGKTNQYNEFQKLNSGGYNPDIQKYGATAQQGYNPLQSQLGSLNQQAAGAANEMGRNQLLQQTVGQPNYSQGQQTLDALFLQGQGNQLKQNLGGIAQSANQNVNQAQSAAQSRLQALQGLSSGNQQYIKDLFQNGNPGMQGAGLNQIGSTAMDQASAANAAQPGILSALQNAASMNKGRGQFSVDQMSQLGLTPGMKAWGVGLGQDLFAAPAATAASITDQNTLNRYNALNQLAGGPNGLQQGTQNPFSGQTVAGGYKPINFDAGKYQTAVNARHDAIVGADLQNAFQGIKPLPFMQNVGNIADIASFNNAQNTTMQSLRDQLNKSFQAGDLNPDQAQNLINQTKQYLLQKTGEVSSDLIPERTAQLNQAFSPFSQYMTDEYMPAAEDILGVAPTGLARTPQGIVGGR